MSAPAIILVAPQLGENIGAAARAMANFGLSELRLVAPRDGWPNPKAVAAASGASSVIDAARIYPRFEDSIADMHWVAATTARPRDMAKPVLSPERAITSVMQRMSSGARCALVFGPERTGLENDDIAQADALVIAPVNPSFASLNLAQAVLLLGYEWMKQTGQQHGQRTLGRATERQDAAEEGLNRRGSEVASKRDLLGFYEHLERELDDAGFLKPPEKRPAMVRNLRSMFARMAPSEQEVRTLRGIVAALTYTHKRSRKVP